MWLAAWLLGGCVGEEAGKDLAVDTDAVSDPGPTDDTDTVVHTDGAPPCGNGVLDPGEACDGDCPTACDTPAWSCETVELQGSAATCDAACVSTPVARAWSTSTAFTGAQLLGPDGTSPLALDAAGVPHLLTADRPTGRLVHVQGSATGGWDAHEVLPASSFPRSPALTVGPDGVLHGLTWLNGSRALVYLTSADGVTWTDDPVFTHEATGFAWNPDIAVAPDGTVHLLHVEQYGWVGPEIRADLFHRTVQGPGDYPVAPIHQTCNSGRHARMLFEAGGTPHVLFHRTSWAGCGGQPLHTSHNGVAWSAPQAVYTIPSPYIGGAGYALSATWHGGSLVAAFQASASGSVDDPDRPDGPRLSTQQGGSWSTEVFDDEALNGDLEVVSDAHGVLRIVYLGPEGAIREAVGGPSAWDVADLPGLPPADSTTLITAAVHGRAVHVLASSVDDTELVHGWRCLAP